MAANVTIDKVFNRDCIKYTVKISCRRRGLTNNVEPLRSLRVNRPSGDRQAEKRACSQIASGSNDLP